MFAEWYFEKYTLIYLLEKMWENQYAVSLNNLNLYRVNGGLSF